MKLFFILTFSCFSHSFLINNEKHSSYVIRRIKHNSIEIYEKLITLENWINNFLSYPNVTFIADLCKYLETYNQLFNVVVVKVKIKDRMYCRSVQRLLEQRGPTFLQYDYTFNFLTRFWGWSHQHVVILRTWLTDTSYTWALLKRFVNKYNYPIKQAYDTACLTTMTHNCLNKTRINEVVNVTENDIKPTLHSLNMTK